MPTVYVIPPEEDLEQPWCFFDAEYPHGEPSDLDSEHAGMVHDTVTLNPDTPPFHRNFIAEDVVMPRKTTESPFSLEDDAEDEDHDEDITIRGNEPGDFSEIIEVVKVKRYGDRDAHRSSATPKPQKTSMKRSETFFSKASRAFRSIKNVNRSSHSGQPRPSTKEVFQPQDTGSSVRSTISSVSSVNDPSIPPKNRSARRRGSVVLSQIFAPSQSTKRRESSETYPTPSSFPSRRSSSSLFSSYSERPNENTPHVERSASPAPSSRVSRRFSVLSLFSKASEGLEQGGQFSPSTSGDLLDPSSTSTYSTISDPPTPDGIPPPVPPKAAVPLLKRLPSFMRKDVQGKVEAVPAISPAVLDTPFDAGGDISFEMRLDSLHFDDLTFDPDQFQFQ